MAARQAAVDRNRDRLLEAAYELFVAEPYDLVTLDAVAGVAGVTRQTLLRQFGSKDGLFTALVDWLAPREDAARQADPGDLRSGIANLLDRYEATGDANIRFLELEGRTDAIDYLLAQGRQGHRAWIEHLFAAELARLRDSERDRVLFALYAATDVSVWKLLRRDFDLPRSKVEAIVRKLVEGVLGTLSTFDEGGA